MIKGLFHRRIPQIAGVYLAASWGIVEFADFLVGQFSLSPAVINLVLILLLIMLPAVVVLAWRHGAPGADEWTKVDGAVIGLNLTAAAGILFVTFGGQELGAATTVKLVEDAEGNTVERVVPKAAFRRNLLVYNFDNESGDSDLDWLGSGVVTGVVFDLAQDVFVNFVLTQDATVRERLAQAGFEPTDKIPLSLKREAAELRNLGHFMDGAVRTAGDSLVIETRLYETNTARQMAARSYRGTDPLEMSDRISVDLRRDLGIPDWQIDESIDLPASELLTTSPDAFRAFAEAGLLALSNQNAETRSMAEQAVALDSTFAMAHLVAAGTALSAGNQAEAEALMTAGARYSYRLPERVRLNVQVVDQWIYKQDPEAAARSARLWTEIYPQDASARRVLADIYRNLGNTDGQLAQYRSLLALDSVDVETMRRMAGAFRIREDYDSAFAYYERLKNRLPTDVRTRRNLAGTLTSLGRYSEARDELEQARVAVPGDPGLPAELAGLDIREGHYEEAIERLELVNSLERTPTEHERRVGLEESVYYRRGQFVRLEDAYRRRLAALNEIQVTVNVIGGINGSEFLVYAVEGGVQATALAQIDSLRNEVEEPWNLFVEIPAVRIHLDLGDVESARASLTGLRTLFEALATTRNTRSYTTWIEGRIAELEDGHCQRAIDIYDEAISLAPLEEGYHRTRLRCLTSLERWNDAEGEVAWLLERYPGYATYRLAIARYHAARGQTADAISHLEDALGFWSEADPEYIPAQEARALLAELQGS